MPRQSIKLIILYLVNNLKWKDGDYNFNAIQIHSMLALNWSWSELDVKI